MKKKLLAILGSPHENGSTAAMLRCMTQAAQADGWSVTTISLYQKTIAYCQGCRACIQAGACVVKDDIKEMEALLQSCDRVVLAAPTYWANVPAVVKNLFDRLLGTAMEETAAFPRPRLSARQEYILLTACNTPFPFSRLCGQSRGALRAMHEFFKNSGMKRRGAVVYAGAKGRGDLPLKTVKKIERLWGSTKVRQINRRKTG